MIEFRIEEIDEDGNLADVKPTVAWLIKEGETVQCSCPDKVTAGYARKYFKELALTKQHLKDVAYHEKIRIDELEFVVETKLALEVITELKELLSSAPATHHKNPALNLTKKPGNKKTKTPTGKRKG